MATENQLSSLEQELNALLEVERFEPPAEFRSEALLSDPAVYEEASADPEARRPSCSTGRRRRPRASTTPTRPSTRGSPTAS
jgi:hypothetical protein